LLIRHLGNKQKTLLIDIAYWRRICCLDEFSTLQMTLLSLFLFIIIINDKWLMHMSINMWLRE